MNEDRRVIRGINIQYVLYKMWQACCTISCSFFILTFHKLALFIFPITTGMFMLKLKELSVEFYWQLICNVSFVEENGKTVVKSHAAFLRSLTATHASLLPSPYSHLSFVVPLHKVKHSRLSGLNAHDKYILFSFHFSRFLFLCASLLNICTNFYVGSSLLLLLPLIIIYDLCTCCIRMFQDWCIVIIFSLFRFLS